MKRPDETSKELLSAEYILEHGILVEELVDEYYYDDNGVYHYEQMFDKPKDEGGKPFSGLAYELRNGILVGYTEYKDGYQNGDNVTYYLSGTLRRYSRYTDTENYIYEWYENGTLSYIKHNHRKDNPQYYRTKEFDESGKLLKQTIYCEIQYVYDYNSPNTIYEVTWHKNGEFKLIRNTVPTKETFYCEMEFDENGYPVRFVINQNYSPEYLSAQRHSELYHIKIFDKDYHFDNDVLMCSSEYGWLKYSGKLIFLYKSGEIEKIMKYKDGLPCGAQYIYYKNGELKEEYCISKGKEYNRHIRWFENSTIQEAVIYSRDSTSQYHILFNENGNIAQESGSII